VRAISASTHDITPAPGSARTRDSEPADLRTVAPGTAVTARCAGCGREIACDRYGVLGWAWRHVPGPGEDES
jgi:hypothetical protein